MKTLRFTMWLLLATPLYTRAQPTGFPMVATTGRQLGVHLSYNAEQNQYEVYATANFSQTGFALGPSQITVAVPRSVADQSLSVFGGSGRWTDYSSVFAPAAAPGLDFHGVNSIGRILDVQADVPLLLFAFRLPGGYIEGVRLYANGRDPRSAQAGMGGGDFSNTLQDHRGIELFRPVLDTIQLANLSISEIKASDATLTVFPNPITGDSFRVTLKGYPDGARLRLRLLSATGVEFGRLEESADKLINYSIRVPRQLTGQAYLLTESLGNAPGRTGLCNKLLIMP
ncbi:hypothetical protein F5984_24625 [Rudanella paleaurantiibacter]|uniref:Uncharacterized protein n=1 Tax=Rudanella paleaurantiibacter TaxID=2614655 RepID=A0A7J5TUV7_9BACT|nr:hypothetical protein [Rudanella paleaurantiibacter]KAB7726503.1 hypothetical protein F5984_24625 [Rudanella paleaurantiibacter]